MDGQQPTQRETNVATASPDTEAARDALFACNMAAFEKHAPGVHRQLAAIVSPKSAIVGTTAAGDLNLDLGHTTFYDPDAVTYSERQVSEDLARPLRFYLHPPAFPEDAQIGRAHV